MEPKPHVRDRSVPTILHPRESSPQPQLLRRLSGLQVPGPLQDLRPPPRRHVFGRRDPGGQCDGRGPCARRCRDPGPAVRGTGHAEECVWHAHHPESVRCGTGGRCAKAVLLARPA